MSPDLRFIIVIALVLAASLFFCLFWSGGGPR